MLSSWWSSHHTHGDHFSVSSRSHPFRRMCYDWSVPFQVAVQNEEKGQSCEQLQPSTVFFERKRIGIAKPKNNNFRYCIGEGGPYERVVEKYWKAQYSTKSFTKESLLFERFGEFACAVLLFYHRIMIRYDSFCRIKCVRRTTAQLGLIGPIYM